MTRQARLITPTTTLTVLLLSVIALGSWGCPVKFVSDYDEVTDQTATALQTKVDTFVLKMSSTANTPEGTYANNKNFYDEMKGALQALQSRSEAIPLNQPTVSMVKQLQENMEILRTLHEKGGANGLRPEIAGPALSAIDTQFRSIISFEDAKKRGK
jgi:D-aminopeptidase